MSAREKLTDTEWIYLQRTLEAATDAVIVAHPGGTFQEGVAVIHGWAEAPKRFPDTPFVLDLFQATPHELRLLNDEASDNPDRSTEEIISDAAAMCRKSVALLQAKSPNDLPVYQQVVYFLIEKVARASREGGFLGFGGKSISEAEQTVLDRLTEALTALPSPPSSDG